MILEISYRYKMYLLYFVFEIDMFLCKRMDENGMGKKMGIEILILK